MPDFSGVERKVKRAREHYDALKQAIDSLESDFARDGVVVDRDAKRGSYVWRVQIDESRLAPLPLLFGDFVHNLRSALDHIVWGLASEEHHGRRPFPEFPIFLKPGPGHDGFHASGIPKIWSLPEEAKILIERVQPYQRPHWDGWHQPGVDRASPLYDIRNLDNIDKHRRLVITTWLVSGYHGFGPDGALNALRVRSGKKKNGSIVAELPIESGYSPEDVEFKPAFEITMDEEQREGLSVVIFASNLYHRVGIELIDKFRPFFS